MGSLIMNNPSQVVLVNSTDVRRGYADVEEAHTGRGKKHRAFVTLLFDSQNQVLLQRRKHRLFGGLWDFTAISHNLHLADHDETYQEASDRAIKKEMGIGHVDVNKIGAFNYFAKDGKSCEREYCAVLTGLYSGKFRSNPDEVYEAKWISFEDFIGDIAKTPKKYTPWAKKAVKVLVNDKSLMVNALQNQFRQKLEFFVKEFTKFSKQFFSKKQKLVEKYPSLITRFYRELEEFGAGGKAMRPFLVYLGYKVGADFSEVRLLARSDLYKRILPVCLAVEFIHNFLLIHDDIIDKSDVRRGKPTVHKKFERGYDKHYGMSQAILAGDIALLEAFGLVNKSDFGNRIKSQCLDTLVNFVLETGYGEALDIENSYKNSSIGDIWRVVELKTARYSFVGPLTLGAILAGAKKSQVEALTKYALNVGKAFQLQDDILGVFADEKTLGKSTLSDMKEGKNTVLFYKTRELATGSQRRNLDRLWGNSKSDASDLDVVREIMRESGALSWCQGRMQKLIIDAKKSIAKVTKDRKLAGIFVECADFAIFRER